MVASQFAKDVGIYISMPPGIARGLSSSCSSEMRASVVSIKPSIDAAFCNAQRVTFAGSMIPATSGIGAASVLKAIPVIGTIAGGFVMPALSAGATYAIGKAFIQHFATGGTLLDFNPPDYRQFIKAQRDMWDSRKNRAAKSPEAGAATGP